MSRPSKTKVFFWGGWLAISLVDLITMQEGAAPTKKIWFPTWPSCFHSMLEALCQEVVWGTRLFQEVQIWLWCSGVLVTYSNQNIVESDLVWFAQDVKTIENQSFFLGGWLVIQLVHLIKMYSRGGNPPKKNFGFHLGLHVFSPC